MHQNSFTQMIDQHSLFIDSHGEEGARFDSADFSGNKTIKAAVFDDSFLPKATFDGDNFNLQTLTNIDFTEATFYDCSFYLTRFIGCSFKGAKFVACDIDKCHFQDCDVRFAKSELCRALTDPTFSATFCSVPNPFTDLKKE